MRAGFALIALLCLPGWAVAEESAPAKPAGHGSSNAHKTAAHTRPGKAGPQPPGAGHAPKAKPATPQQAPAAAVPPATSPPESEKPTEPPKGSVTGLPLPRFAALRSDEVNFRTGPGTRYPIEWVYKRRDLPVEIEREFEVWRLVRDPEGAKGWVHQATLVGRRTGIVTGQEPRPLRQAPDDGSGVVAKLNPGVIVRLRSCEAGSDWCQAQVGDYRGWINRSVVWGILPGEAIQ